MTWSKPDFVEIMLGMEVTAYVNTDGSVQSPKSKVQGPETTGDDRELDVNVFQSDR